MKINQFIDTLGNIIENIDRLTLYKELSYLKDEISTLNFPISKRIMDSKGKKLKPNTCK